MNKRIKLKTIIENLQKILFFVYIMLFYIFGGITDKVVYSEIVLVMFLGLEFFHILAEKKLKIGVPIIILAAFAFFCYLSNFWAINATASINNSITLFLLVIFLAFSYNFFSRIKDGEKIVLKYICWAGILFAIYVILYYGISEYINMLLNGKRIGSEINNVNTIGLQTSISVIICFFYGLMKKQKIYYLLAIIPLVVSFGTGSRKVIITIFLGLILLTYMYMKENKNVKGMIKNIFVITGAIILLIAISRISIFEEAFSRLKSFTNIFSEDKTVDASTEVRMDLIIEGLNVFYENPLFGIGIANSSYAVSQQIYLHNNYVELLACVGIIGTILYYSVYVYLIYKLWKKRNKYSLVVLVIFLLNLVLDFAKVSYYDKGTYIYFLLAMLVIKGEDKIENEKDRKYL